MNNRPFPVSKAKAALFSIELVQERLELSEELCVSV